jgi:hypothetical protein
LSGSSSASARLMGRVVKSYGKSQSYHLLCPASTR